jgi:uncharacterized protein (DUF305 family)
MFHSTRILATVVFTGSLLLTACGSGSDADSSASPEASASPGATATFNDADVLFAQGMIPHHQQALDLAAVALDPKFEAGEEVRTLATAIQGGQQPEIERMTTWLQGWGQPMEMPGMDDADHMATMNGMMTDEQMTSLQGMSGPDFDTAWLTMMIAHHEGAIAQAESAKAAATNPDVTALADQIIAAQQGEITEMQALLDA